MQNLKPLAKLVSIAEEASLSLNLVANPNDRFSRERGSFMLIKITKSKCCKTADVHDDIFHKIYF